MVCITGAGGTVGGEVVRQLEAKNVPFRMAFNSPAKAEAARSKGYNAVVIDYSDPESLVTAFSGCDRILLVGPNTLDQTALELNAVEAAKTAGVKHVVKQSVLGAEGEAYSLAHVHRPVEKAIEASGMTWTFLRPNSFMQNVVTFMSGTILDHGAFYSSSGDALVSHVDVRDIAAVAVEALTGEGHERKAYDLTGPQAISYDDLAAKLTDTIGRDVKHVSMDPVDLKHAMVGEGMPEQLADRMLDLERYFREDRASHITPDVYAITGRNPGEYGDYLRDTVASGVWSRGEVAS